MSERTILFFGSKVLPRVLHLFYDSMKYKKILKEYLLNATFHGAKFIIDEQYHLFERYVL